MSLTPAQVLVIKATVPVLQEYSNAITIRFYEEMLREVQDLQNIFNQTNQINGHQADALAKSLCAYASHIDDLGTLSPALERICHKHASLYVNPGQYEIVGAYLLQAMKEILGDALTAEIHDAWAAAYQQLANLMIDREAQLLKETGSWNNWRDFQIAAKVQESPHITSFHLAPLDKQPLPEFFPGQYISIRMPIPGFDYQQARQYSLSDMPRPDYYRISVKNEPILKPGHLNAKAHPGYLSNILHTQKSVGDIVQVSHPAGEFFFDPQENVSSDGPIVLISAGIGLTPNLAILNTMTARKSKRKISWVHATRSSSVQAFGNYILNLASEHPHVRTYIFNKEPSEEAREGIDYQFKGRMSLHKLHAEHDLFVYDARTVYYICGPDKFMTDMQTVLRSWNVDNERIKLEVFGTG